MSLSTAQLAAFRAALLAETDPELVEYRTNGSTPLIAQWYSRDAVPDFVVFRASVQTAEVGRTVNYEAVGAMTTANRDRIITFYTLNPMEFPPVADVRAFWNNTFSGALAGQGAATREALEALWRRKATRIERLFATGTGSVESPGALVYQGSLSEQDVTLALAEE